MAERSEALVLSRFTLSQPKGITFKSIVMLKHKIKTHKLGATYRCPHFFILNKGKNSGKPAGTCWTNCFVFLADNDEEREFYFFLFLGLWELGFFKPHLIGSVVEYIHLGDLCDIAEEALNNVNSGERSFMEINSTLQQIERHKAKLQEQVGYLMQLRKALFSKYLRSLPK
jgi:hypothetical protein